MHSVHNRDVQCFQVFNVERKTMILDIVSNAQEAAHSAVSNGWDILEQGSLFFRQLPYLIPDALNGFFRSIFGF